MRWIPVLLLLSACEQISGVDDLEFIDLSTEIHDHPDSGVKDSSRSPTIDAGGFFDAASSSIEAASEATETDQLLSDGALDSTTGPDAGSIDAGDPNCPVGTSAWGDCHVIGYVCYYATRWCKCYADNSHWGCTAY